MRKMHAALQCALTMALGSVHFAHTTLRKLEPLASRSDSSEFRIDPLSSARSLWLAAFRVAFEACNKLEFGERVGFDLAPYAFAHCVQQQQRQQLERSSHPQTVQLLRVLHYFVPR